MNQQATTVSRHFLGFWKSYKRNYLKDKEPSGEKVVKVNEIISKVALIYEKIRSYIDYREEHLIRKNAIERSLRRRLMPGVTGSKVAFPLVQELIRAGYLSNNKVPEQKVHEIGQIINKYIYIYQRTMELHKEMDPKKIYDWIIGVMSSDIDENITSFAKEQLLIDYMFHALKDKIEFEEKNYPREELEVEIYIAIQKALIKSDVDMIRYRLLKIYYPREKTELQEYLDQIAEKFPELANSFNRQMKHPLQDRLVKLLKKYATIFHILDDVITKNYQDFEKIVANPLVLEQKMVESANHKYKTIRKKLTRSIIRSIIYIFITKMVLVLLLEIPLDLFIYKEFSVFALVVNISLPPVLMLLYWLTLRKPKKANTDKIVSVIKEVVYGSRGEATKHIIKKKRRRGRIFSFVYNLFYLFTYIISFSLIIYFLRKIHFNAVSILIFIFFLSLVSFFGIRIRQSARELLVVDKSENFFTFLFDFFSLPIIKVGKFLTEKFSKINIFLYIFDFIFEAPLQAFIEIVEDWFSFFKEKKDEVY